MAQRPQTDDPKMRAIIDGKRRRRCRGWKTSADHYDPAKIKGASDEFVAWIKAHLAKAES